MREKKESLRIILIGVLFSGILLSLILTLYQIQIINGQTNAGNIALKTVKEMAIKSTRGNIYDRNGKLLAGSRLAYTLTIEDKAEYKTNRERQLVLNGVCFKLVKALKNNGDTLNNELKIKLDNKGNFVFLAEGTGLKRFRADVFGKAKVQDLNEEETGASAGDMVKYLSGDNKFALYSENNRKYTKEELEQYGLKENYSREEQLNIIGLRYMLSLNVYHKYLPVTVAMDVSEKTAVYVMENSRSLTGAQIQADSVRVYEGGEAFSHILGYTGKISEDELTRLKQEDSDYLDDSLVGKTGIEQSMESILKGKDGVRKVYVNSSGRVIKEVSRVEPVSGKDVYLSIDKDLQTAVYNILEQHIAGILLDNLINAKAFDKTGVRDASDIKIPVYDVYYALIHNNILYTEELGKKNKSELEQKINNKFQRKKKESLKELRTVLRGDCIYSDLNVEMQEYAAYMVNVLLPDKLKLWERQQVEERDPVYARWINKKISLKEYLSYAIEKGWITVTKLSSGNKYVDIQEAYGLVVDEILGYLENDKEFHKLLYKFMLQEDIISGKDICGLLYQQGFFKKGDEDYQQLINNQISAYDFIRRKIKKLEITPAKLALDPCSGSAVIIEPGTGKVLACVTYPGYDNNRLANRMDSSYYNQMVKDLSLPFYNRATQQLTAPGSTFKPITVIAGLEEGVINPDTSIICDGVFDKVAPPLKCWKRSGHGKIKNAAAAIENSCNDYLCDISYRLGMKGKSHYAETQALTYLQDYTREFNLDKKTGIEITESTPHVTDRYAIPSAIGQGTHNYTTIQLARYVNTLANRGMSYRLSLIDQVSDGNTGTTKKRKAKIESRIELTQKAWDTVDLGMYQFAQSNTILKDLKIKIAGKTGTAQEAKNRPDHALFIGYAPAKDPQISIAVRIANGYASGNAVSAAKDMINYYFNLEKKESIITGQAVQSSRIRSD